MIRQIKFVVLLGLFTLFAHTSSAATMNMVPSTGEFGIGKEITIDLKVDSEGAGVNVAQATIRFPSDILKVNSISKEGSALNFWLEDPVFSNENGTISFVGGTAYGVSGASIQLIHIVFTAKTAGTAGITILDAAVTASDGSGANLLTKTQGATLTLSPSVTTPIVTAPTQIIRKSVAASGLPTKPTLTIPLYPDSLEWYNSSNIFSVSWTLPADVSRVATAINQEPNFDPTDRSQGLFDNKSFGALADGRWYLHVRFMNNVGWGPTTHHRLSVDTQPPLPFDITSDDGATTDNPSPTIKFKTSDTLSGISHYRLKLNNEQWETISAKDFTGSIQPIHKEHASNDHHNIIVQAVDHAGNSIENSISQDITPLASPIFTFISTKLFSDETRGLTAKGTALPNTEILLSLTSDGAVITSGIVSVNNEGNWEYTFAELLRNGKYLVTIQTKDSRGALSDIVLSPYITVTNKYTKSIILLFAILLGALVGGYYFFKKRRERTALRIDVAGSDTSKVFNMLQADIEKLKKAQGTATTADDAFMIEKMEADLKKMGKYVEKEITRAKE